MDTRRELGAFLRAAREQVAPVELGLPDTGRRRTPGLRREEVAAASGIGLAWYTWLEQGRVSTSRQVLESVARTLKLGPDARTQLLALGGFTSAGEPEADRIAELRPLLASWPHSPALLLDHSFDVHAANDAYRVVWPEPGENLLLHLATSEAAGERLGSGELLYQLFLRFRMQADRRGADPRVRRVFDDLRRLRPDLGHWWACRGVPETQVWESDVLVPDGPRLRFAFSLLLPGGASAAALLVQAPADAGTAEWMRLSCS
ncbi:helix-turn-helix domain-containing protein [Saccharopolyspora taberi]|uniref:Helix-turn-helix transcriptional regulator n=1 Tax=Saccharopolyspora taberi TaxID=60895 RepID=A0ABN3VFX3_9PSEU